MRNQKRQRRVAVRGQDRGEVRIIGGYLRHRKLTFPSKSALRPTPNRVRETLFNWLTPYIAGAHCLDLFAGSGALGFEAISRGAVFCLSLEADSDLIHAIHENKAKLGVGSLEVVHARFPYDVDLSQKFSIVFVDPPFHGGYIPLVFEWLSHKECLEKSAIIYVESESDQDVFEGLSGVTLLKDKIAGDVRYSLVRLE